MGLEQHINYLKCNKLEAETIFGKNYFDKFDKNTLIVTNGSKNVEYNKGKIYFIQMLKKLMLLTRLEQEIHSSVVLFFL